MSQGESLFNPTRSRPHQRFFMAMVLQAKRERKKKTEVSITGFLQSITFSTVYMLYCNEKDRGGKFVQNRDHMLSTGPAICECRSGRRSKLFSFKKLGDLSL